jgi:hypothetical protein
MPIDFKKMSKQVTLTAIQLLGQWNRVSQVHLSLGAGCMCNGAMPGLAVSDLELNILDYLNEKYQKNIDFNNWLRIHAQYQEGLTGSLSELLKNIAIHPPSIPLAVKVLKDLSNTISSLDERHQL